MYTAKNRQDIRRPLSSHIISVLLICIITACEVITPELTGGKIDMVNSLTSLGVRGYALDSVYTEFDYYEGRSRRIAVVRKQTIKYGDDRPEFLSTDISSVRPEYKGSSIIYADNGLRSEIVLNAYGFAEYVINHNVDGSLHSVLAYGYDAVGYLRIVRLERPGTPITFISYMYEENGIRINENPGPDEATYWLPLSVEYADGEIKKAENTGYVCNVLRLANSPLTNMYVIMPDLYYFGIYGTPVKYLPEADIVWESKNAHNSDPPRIVRVNNNLFFYD